jgi:drug/metabolite transporter (DMT)-like permease
VNYFLTIIATLLLAYNFVLTKKYEIYEGTSPEMGLKFNSVNGLITAVIFFAFSGFRIDFSRFSFIIAIAMTSCAVAYTVLGFKVLKSGNMALYSLFLMSGGMVLPYLFGVMFLDEQLTLFRIAGLIFILCAIIISNLSSLSMDKNLILLCISIFVLNGFVSIFSKCHQIFTEYKPVDTTLFVLYTGIAKFVLCEAVLLFYKKEKKKISFSTKNSLPTVAGAALIGGISYALQLIGAKNLPATVLYPMITGGCIVFSSVFGIIFFKERISSSQKISIILCFIGTLLFL